MSKLLTAGSQVQASWWFVYLKLHVHVNYIVVLNSKATLLEKGSGCFGLLCIFWSFMYIFGVLCIFYRGTNKAQEEKSIFPRPDKLIQLVDLGLKPKLTLKSKPA